MPFGYKPGGLLTEQTGRIVDTLRPVSYTHLIGGRADAVMHPLALAARSHNSGLAQVGQVA